MPRCRANITMPYHGGEITVCLLVQFEVDRADPSVGIFCDSIAAWTADVIDADVEPCAADVLAELQEAFDATAMDYADDIESACEHSLISRSMVEPTDEAYEKIFSDMENTIDKMFRIHGDRI